MRTRLSLLRRVRCVLRVSSELEHWMMNWTTKLRMPMGFDQVSFKAGVWKTDSEGGKGQYRPWHCSRGRTFSSRHDDIVENLKAEICQAPC